MYIDLFLRILAGALLGGLIGFEREFRAKVAGFRTHFLVALGSALFMVMSQFGFENMVGVTTEVSLDPSRIASQVVTGIGFIGAGTIIFQKNMVHGLTTAAGLWVTSAIGMACGAGFYVISLLSTALVLLCLETLYWVRDRFGRRRLSVSFAAGSEKAVRAVLERISNEHVMLYNYEIREGKADGAPLYMVSMDIGVKQASYGKDIMNVIDSLEGVTIKNLE